MLSRAFERCAQSTVVGVLAAPATTFRRVAVAGRGFGALLLMLACELVLVFPLRVANAVMRVADEPLGAVAALWSQYVGYALGPAGVIFAAGYVLKQILSRRPAYALDLWSAVSVLSYAWVPHLLLTALGVGLGAVGLDPLLLPNHPLGDRAESWLLALGRLVIALGPPTALAVLAVRALVAGPPARAPAVTRARRNSVAGACVLLLCAGLLGAGMRLGREWHLARPVRVGDALAPLTLVDLQGRTLATSALRGKVVLLDFWASWCPPCVAATPALVRLARELHAQPFALVSVNVEPDNLEAVRAFARQHALPFPVYVDAGALQLQLRVQTLPTAFLIDRGGTVRKTYVGAHPIAELRDDVRALLSQATEPVP